jgi:Lon protease-like protein
VRDRLAELGFSGTVPVFPLPDVVFFPGVLLSLHVFEPRYQALVADARRGEGLIAIATLLPGWERDYDGAPPFHPLATIGRLGEIAELADGRSNITLLGLERAHLEEEFTDRPYRLARARVAPDRAPDPADADELAELKDRLLLAYGYYLQVARMPTQPITLSAQPIPFETGVHLVCQNLESPVIERLRALEAAGPAERLPIARAMLAGQLDGVLAKRGMAGLRTRPGEQN